jgi:hypothetical protein
LRKECDKSRKTWDSKLNCGGVYLLVFACEVSLYLLVEIERTVSAAMILKNEASK